MTGWDWAVIGDRVVLLICCVTIVLYACGVIR